MSPRYSLTFERGQTGHPTNPDDNRTHALNQLDDRTLCGLTTHAMTVGCADPATVTREADEAYIRLRVTDCGNCVRVVRRMQRDLWEK